MLNSLLLSDDRRPAALVVGGLIGVLGGVFALLIVLLGPVMTFGALLGLGVGLYALSNLYGALGVLIAVVALIPFGNLPVPFSPTPTFLDAALGGFFLVYAAQWMTGERRLFRTTPVTPVVLGFTGIIVFAYLLGLRYAPLDSRTLRVMMELVLSLLLIPVLTDVISEPQQLRRVMQVLILCGAASALIGIVVWALPDFTAEALLNRMGRFGYPVGGVLRYRETYGSVLNERAIGLWIDPNAFGGFLLMVGAVTAPQIFAERPVFKRWIVAGLLGVIVLAIFLTDSRGSMLSLAVALAFVATLRYRRLLVIMGIAVVIALFLPITQRYVAKLEAGLNNQDVETQMRFGEYKDALRLIERHPVMGVGFSGTPEIDLYLGVANTYLTIASNAGLVGLAAYLLMMGSPFVYGWSHYRRLRANPLLGDIWLGLAAGLVGALGGGMFDHFYFKPDQFLATMVLVWIILGLMLAATRLAAIAPDSASELAAGESP